MNEIEIDDIEKLKRQIIAARAFAERIFKNRARAIALMGGLFMEPEFIYPEPDTMEVYPLMFGHRMEPTTFRLSFGKPLKWVGISHPWGVKPADIEIPQSALSSIGGELGIDTIQE